MEKLTVKDVWDLVLLWVGLSLGLVTVVSVVIIKLVELVLSGE